MAGGTETSPKASLLSRVLALVRPKAIYHCSVSDHHSMSNENDPKTWGQRTSARIVAAHFADQVANRVILLTGPTVGGVGYATALALAEHGPALLVLAGRTPSK